MTHFIVILFFFCGILELSPQYLQGMPVFEYMYMCVSVCVCMSIQGQAKVDLHLLICKTVHSCILLIIVLFICITTVNLLLPTPILSTCYVLGIVLGIW